MAQRTVCLCDGKYIGIETIYTVVDGRQVNIPERLKELRAKSRSNQLFCPCGCGSNLILVAGDRNLREQHFRLKDGEFNQNCHAVTEGSCSIDSKIVLKCWLISWMRERWNPGLPSMRLTTAAENMSFPFCPGNRGLQSAIAVIGRIYPTRNLISWRATARE